MTRNSPPHVMHLRVGALVLVMSMAGLAIAGCGQVITLQPTPTPEPTATLSVAVVVATLPPTATPAPYTPEPTPTPTVTPPPIVHVIQSGESMLSIATQYDISVAALQDANGILDPRFLQIGEQLIIPRREEVEAAEVSLLDDAGQEIGKADGLVALDLVGVNERAPFAILFGETQAKFAQYRVYPLHAVPAYVGSYYRDLEVNNLQSDGERYAAYTVTGRVKNVGPEEAVQVQVVLTAYDPLGRVVATRKVEPDYNVVPVGGETTFTAVLAPAGGPVERVTAVAQGRRISAVQQ
jgi:LysM repeat protein